MMGRVTAHEIMEYAGAEGGQEPLDPEQVFHTMDIYVNAKLAVEVEADNRVFRTTSLKHYQNPVQFFGDAGLSLTG